MDLVCTAFAAAALLSGLAALVLFLRLRERSETAGRLSDALEASRTAHAESERRLAETSAREAFLAPLQRRLEEAQARNEALSTRVAAHESTIAAQEAAHARFRTEMDERFGHLASSALKSNEESFLRLAREAFEKHKGLDAEAAEKRQKALDALVDPLNRAVVETNQRLAEIEKARTGAQSELKALMTSVSHEAARLTNALKSSASASGSWGEQSLRNALERAGLSPYCDFDMQRTFGAGSEKLLRPDCVIHLPGDRRIVVDAKASTQAFLEGCEATDDQMRTACFRRHADSMRQRMLDLARKDYAKAVSAGLAAEPDFVVMFVPGESFFAAALQHRADLLQEALDRDVFIVTPTTLIALARAIALGWQQVAVAEDARKIARHGRELYERLAKMGDHLGKVGRTLSGSVSAYNELIGSMERRVMPEARRLKEYDAIGSAKVIETTEEIDLSVRRLRRDGDLRLAGGPEIIDLPAE